MATRSSPPERRGEVVAHREAVLGFEGRQLAEPLRVVLLDDGQHLVGDLLRLLGEDAAHGVGVGRHELEGTHGGRRADPRRHAPALPVEAEDSTQLALGGDALVLEDHELHVAKPQLLGDPRVAALASLLVPVSRSASAAKSQVTPSW